MPWAGQGVFQLTLLWTSVAAACLAALFLAVELCASRNWARRLPAITTIVLAALAIFIWIVQGPRPGVACGLLAGFCLLAWSLSLESVRQQLARRLTPKALWGMALLASVAASQLLGSQLLRTVRDVAVPREIDLADSPIKEIQGLTDRGRAIALFHFETVTPTDPVEAAILAAGDYQNRAIRLAVANSACNCHGWVFTGGQYGIRNPDVPAILADNGYAAVEQPQEGDLAIYRNGDGCTHSGLVRLRQPGGLLLVESKWGPFGVFLHEPTAQPFSGECTFYRSSRSGHLLELSRQ